MTTKSIPAKASAKACPREVVDHNQQLARVAHMDIKKLKAIKGLIVTVAIALIAVVGIYAGADPTTTSWIALAGILLINGIELSELLAVAAAATDSTNPTNPTDSTDTTESPNSNSES